MAGNLTIRASAWTSMLTTELNSLANTSGALQATGTNAAFDNTLAANLYTRCRPELTVTFGSAPALGTTVDLYCIPLSSDATTYNDGSSGATPYGPPECYVGSFPLDTNTTKQIHTLRGGGTFPMGYEVVKFLAINSSGLAFPASGSTIKARFEGDAYT